MENNLKKALVLALFLVVGIARLDAQATVHYVNVNRAGADYPYTNWTTAAKNIQAAWGGDFAWVPMGQQHFLNSE